MSDNGTATAVREKTSERNTRRPKTKRRSDGDMDCLAASFFALKNGGVENGKRKLKELNAQHAQAIKFVVQCGGIEEAVARLDLLDDRLQGE